ncbi:MAG: hypothetical protein ACOY9D_09730 [Pseudomonadota bacterium]
MMIDRYITRLFPPKDRFVLLAVCLCSIVLVTYPVFDFDLYWHLANGREMVNSGRIVSEEVFSYTHQGEKFANHEWLGQIIFYLLWTAFGAYGLLGFKLLLVTLMVWLLFRTLRDENTTLGAAALLCVLVVLAGINRYHERPELFSLFYMALLGFILYGFRARKLPRRMLWAIPLIMVTWDWLHGAIYGLTFITLFVAGENAKHRLPMLRRQQSLSVPDLKYLNRCFALIMLAMLINPFGVRSYGIFVDYVVGQGNFNQVITEYMPVTWNEFKVFILMFAWAVLLVLRNWRRVDLTYLLLMVVFGLTALRFNRATSIAAIVLAPVIAGLLRVGIHQAKSALERRLHIATLITAGMLIFIHGYSVKFGEEEAQPDSDMFHYLKVYDLAFGYRMDESFFPVGAVNFIKEQKLAGHLYNSGNLGGYLSYRIAPERKIFQYNISVFGDPFYYVRHPDELAKWDIDYAIIDTESEVSALFPVQDWAAVYHDEAAVLMVRRTPQNEALIREHEAHYFNPAFSNASLLERAEDPAILPALAEEMGDHLAYREDDRIAAVWAGILMSHPELGSRPHIRQLLRKALKYNRVAKLAELAGHTRTLLGR